MTMVTPRRTAADRTAPSAGSDRRILADIEETTTRRVVRAVERRRRRAVNGAYAVAVILGAAGTLAFAAIIISGR